MLRGELYLVQRLNSPVPGRQRVFVVVSVQGLIDSRFSTVVCAPIYTLQHGLSTQVPVGVSEGLKRDFCIYCDELVSLPKARLTRYVGSLTPDKLKQLDRALATALDLELKE